MSIVKDSFEHYDNSTRGWNSLLNAVVPSDPESVEHVGTRAAAGRKPKRFTQPSPAFMEYMSTREFLGGNDFDSAA